MHFSPYRTTLINKDKKISRIENEIADSGPEDLKS